MKENDGRRRLEKNYSRKEETNSISTQGQPVLLALERKYSLTMLEGIIDGLDVRLGWRHDQQSILVTLATIDA
jgi:hypothetical protein